jgi:ribonuclease HI
MLPCPLKHKHTSSGVRSGDHYKTLPWLPSATIIDKPWDVYCDGVLGISGAGAATILTSPSGIKLRYAAQLQFTTETEKCSNNIAENEVVLLGLHKLRAMGVQHCIMKIDSKVLASQIEKECIARDEALERNLAVVRRMENFFKGFTLQHK